MTVDQSWKKKVEMNAYDMNEGLRTSYFKFPPFSFI